MLVTRKSVIVCGCCLMYKEGSDYDRNLIGVFFNHLMIMVCTNHASLIPLYVPIISFD